MATRTRNFTGGSYANHWISRLDYWVNWQNAGTNQSSIGMNLYVYSDNGAYTQVGTFDGRIYVNGGEVARFYGSQSTVGTSPRLLTSWSGTVGHDANGYLTISIGDYINAPVNDAARSDFNWGLPRMARAPGIFGISADSIKPTSARLGLEITDLGLGTSASMRMYYRIQGSGSGWSQTADQGDAAGWNYWSVTGLKTATTYEYFGRVWNNNGDTRDSGVQTFKTRAVSGMFPVMMALAS